MKKCYVETLAERDLAREGLKPTAPKDIPYNSTDAKTGLPKGVDKGWDYQVGKTWFPDMDKYDYEIAKQMIAANMKDGVFDRWHQRIADQVAQELKKPEYAGLDNKVLIDRLRKSLTQGGSYPVAALSPRLGTLLGVDTQTVLLSDWDLIKQQVSRSGQSFGAVNYLSAQAVLDAPPVGGQRERTDDDLCHRHRRPMVRRRGSANRDWKRAVSKVVPLFQRERCTAPEKEGGGAD